MSAFADKQIKCIECQKEFTYTAAEQELHKSLGYQNEPKRCNPCREAKRQRRPGGGRERGAAENGAAAAPAGATPAPPPPPQQQQQAPRPPRPPQPQRQPQDRRQGERRHPPQPQGGQRPPRENRGGPGNDPGFTPREFFLAICSECGKEAQLPFKPRGDRPVLCLECFAQKRTG
jgi:CxxC-x17-CxxC domain-containing protein